MQLIFWFSKHYAVSDEFMGMMGRKSLRELLCDELQVIAFLWIPRPQPLMLATLLCLIIFK